MMFVSIISMLVSPLLGIVVEKYRIKKCIFIFSILINGLAAGSFMFFSKLPLIATVEFKCGTELNLTYYDESNQQKNKDISTFIENKIDEYTTCKVKK